MDTVELELVGVADLLGRLLNEEELLLINNG
jgi:hypothetical protein